MELIKQIIISLDDEKDLRRVAAEHLGWPVERVEHIRCLRRSIDARRKNAVRLVYSLEVYARGEFLPPLPSLENIRNNIADWDKPQGRAVVVGAGPSGLFATLTLLKHGYAVDLVERGSDIAGRQKKIARYFKNGELDPDDNVCFGMGGAGLYSDGKLTTRIKHPEVSSVLETLFAFGAPEDILYAHNPHVGSNLIRRVITNMSASLREWGANIHTRTRMTDLLLREGRVCGIKALDLESGEESSLEVDAVFLGCGHGASDVYRLLKARGVMLERKPYAVGLRVQHPQEFINRSQYGEFAGHPALEPASYRLTANIEKLERGVYSFCMCPGGYVLPAATEPESMVVNGMSNRSRSSAWANSAIVATVDERDWAGDELAALDFRRQLEHKAYEAGLHAGRACVPAQNVSDFLQRRMGRLPQKTSCLASLAPAMLNDIFPACIAEALQEGLLRFDASLRNFARHPEALLFGVESRTSAPVRIMRDEISCQSVSHPGLYPIGEGAGYAGGITSAAVDGLRAAMKAVAK